MPQKNLIFDATPMGFESFLKRTSVRKKFMYFELVMLVFMPCAPRPRA
jgi:hypothetical protein